jgi:serine/threonine protein kinase
LGEGGAAVVKKVRRKEDGKMFAAKVMRKYDLEKEMASKAEFDLMTQIPSSTHLIKATEFIACHSWTYLIMELFEGMELQKFVKSESDQGRSLSNEEVKTIMKSLLTGLASLHQAGICHRDIKPENLLVRRKEGG